VQIRLRLFATYREIVGSRGLTWSARDGITLRELVDGIVAKYPRLADHRGSMLLAVNEDIDPDNADALLWAMSYRANPALDLQLLPHRDQGHGPRSRRNEGEDCSVLIDATLKEDFPPISLPKREYMERARVIWEELGLPALKPEAPWYGYSLGDWPAELEQAAQAAVRGEYFATGEKLVTQRRQDVAMNTEVQRHGGEKAESDE